METQEQYFAANAKKSDYIGFYFISLAGKVLTSKTKIVLARRFYKACELNEVHADKKRITAMKESK